MGKKAKLKSVKGLLDDLLATAPEIIPIPKDREVIRAVVMFWREEHCIKCGRDYEGPHHGSDMMIELELQSAIQYFGKFYGWKHKAVIYRPIPDVSCYDHLPHKLVTFQLTIRQCKFCAVIPNVIHLGAVE